MGVLHIERRRRAVAVVLLHQLQDTLGLRDAGLGGLHRLLGPIQLVDRRLGLQMDVVLGLRFRQFDNPLVGHRLLRPFRPVGRRQKVGKSTFDADRPAGEVGVGQIGKQTSGETV